MLRALPTIFLPIGMLIVALAASACGVAGVTTRAAPPDRHAFADAHGRPRAYGGGVCTITSPHTHSYPPVPQAAFVASEDGVVDTRPRYPFWEPHSHHRRTCFRERWHLHLTPPRAELRYMPDRDAYAATSTAESVALLVFSGLHPQRSCDKVKCTFTKPHGHAPCGVRYRAREKQRTEDEKTMENGASTKKSDVDK